MSRLDASGLTSRASDALVLKQAVEGDSMKCGDVSSNGEWATLLIVIDGVERRVAVTREAIEDFLAVDEPIRMTTKQHCEFVRSHMGHLAEAARRKIDITRKSEVIVIRSGDLEQNRLMTKPT